MTAPTALHALIAEFESRAQSPVTFRPPSWSRVLGSDTPALDVLIDEQYTLQAAGNNSDRTVDRQQLHDYVSKTDTMDDTSLLRAFLLVQAWGTGTTGNRTLGHTARAFNDRDNLLHSLRTTTEILRTSDDPSSLAKAYSSWKCAGVGKSFFTKWFAFAGVKERRPWQPLIMDVRVLNTLNNSLGLTTTQLAGTRLWRRRYQSYVEAVHDWAVETETDPQRLEWVLFMQNGRKISE